ncbi:carbohydrate ABC transporter permease [Paenibacillus gansuensis]|uniref:Carbohydrate ABC transporter permease n=1 Tax=Paenibacillus gansuensis TaxID=306542 RepID=A0ABW5PFY3_9BACL
MMDKTGLLLRRFPMYGLLLVFSLATLLPLLWVFLTSLKERKELVRNGPLAWPQVWNWHNYEKAWTAGHFSVYFKNSVFIAAATVIIVLLTVLLASYALSYLQFFGKAFWSYLVMAGLLIPFDLIMIPMFFDLKLVGLLNTRWAVILPQIALSIPFSVFLMRGFMKGMPDSLLEAARIDGAGEFRILFAVVTPIVKPAVISLLIFTLIGSWNNFMLPTIMISDDRLRTVPLGLNAFKTKFTTDITLTSAGAMMIALPVIAVYLVFQRRLIDGLIIGAVKQ